MSEKDVKEINNLISMKRWEGALGVLRRIKTQKRSQGDILKEALLLYNMNMLKECGDLCLESLEKDKNFDLSLLLASCENLYRRRTLLIAPMANYTPADSHVIHSNVASLLAVFCDIREAVFYLNSLIAIKPEPLYKYLLAHLHRLSGKIQDSINIAESISDYAPAKTLLEVLRSELKIVQRRAGANTTEKSEIENMSSLSADELMVRGFWSISERDYQLAFKYFGEALKFDPSLAICWYYVGMLQNFHGAKDRGELCFKKFLDIFPQSSGFYRNLISSPMPGTTQDMIEDYYHRWIGYLPSDPRSWMAYLHYLSEHRDPASVKLLSSEIISNFSKDWFIPKDTSFYYITMGILKFCSGRLSSAEESFRSALKQDGLKSLALIGLGKAAEAHGVAIDANDNYEKASVDENASMISKYLMTNVLLKKKSYKKAFSVIDEVLAKNPLSPIACCKKAEVYLDLSDIKGLRKYLSELRTDQRSPQLAMLTAMICLRESKLSEAVSELEKAMETYPDYYMIMKNLAIMYFKSEQYEQCITFINGISFKPIDPELLLVKATCEYMLGNYDVSHRMSEDYLSIDPFDFCGWHILALSSYRLGKTETAQLAFEKAAQYSGAKVYDRLNLAIFNANIGEYEKALKLTEINSVVFSANADNNYSLLVSWLNYKMGKYSDSLDSLNKMSKGKKISGEVALIRASVEFAQGHLDEARNTINLAIENSTPSSELLYNKAFIFLKENNFKEAEACLNEALILNSSFYEGWIAKAVLGWMIKNEDDVMVALKGAKKLKNPNFKVWLKNASSLKEPLSAISFYDKINLNFYMPDLFSLNYSDPLSIFLFEKLDTVFKK